MNPQEPGADADDEIVVVAVDRDLSDDWDEVAFGGGDPPDAPDWRGGDDDEGGPFDRLGSHSILALYAAAFAIGIALAAAYKAGEALNEVRVGGGA